MSRAPSPLITLFNIIFRESIRRFDNTLIPGVYEVK